MMKVYRYFFQVRTKYIWGTCMLKLPNIAQQTAYSLTREMYLAGCELHIQTLTFLVLTLKQYVNAKTTWGSEVRNINRNDDYCQPLMTYAASIQLILEVFTGRAACFRPESAFYPWSTVVSVHFTLSLHFIPGLQSAVAILWEEKNL